jgi:hypothetical protein
MAHVIAGEGEGMQWSIGRSKISGRIVISAGVERLRCEVTEIEMGMIGKEDGVTAAAAREPNTSILLEPAPLLAFF